MGWKSAEGACNEIWDAYSQKFNDLIDEKISATGGSASQLQECKNNFNYYFPKYRDSALAKMAKKLLEQGDHKKRVGPVCSRHPVPGKKKVGRPRGSSRKRRHVSTGAARGWNNGKQIPYRHRAGRKKH